MKTLITGSSGFVGLALSELLLAAGEDVIGYDINPARQSAREAFAKLPGNFAEEQGSVCDLSHLRHVIINHSPQRMVTLAAITADAERERLTPQAIFEVNVGGVLAAITAAVGLGVSRIVHISSGSVYGSTGRVAKRLDEAQSSLAPEGLYGMSKRSAEEAAQRLAQLQNMPLVIGRLGTCFGPWEADSGFRDTLSAPLQILKLAQAGGTAILPRDSLRDWLYVRDAARAIVCLLDQPLLSYQLYNLGAGFEWNLGKWCERLAVRHPGFAWNVAGKSEDANINLFGNYDRASMSIQRLTSDCGFVPIFDLEEADNDFHQWLAHSGYPQLEAKP